MFIMFMFVYEYVLYLCYRTYSLSVNTFVCVNLSAIAEPSQILLTPFSKIMSIRGTQSYHSDNTLGFYNCKQ